MKAPRYFAIIAALLASVVLPGCNSQKASDGSSTGAITITGAGSSFVAPIMERWIADYRNTHPNVQITYQSIGSGGGIQQLKKQLIDFGASDAALSDDQLKDMPVPVVQIAESAGPVCITYNLPDLKQPLKLSSSALAGIFMGTIKKWNDPSIARSNPGVKLPKDDIIVAHRSDGSGTTNIFTNYLATVSPDWAQKVGKGLSLNWPVGVGGKGSEGVTGVVKQSPGGIGYVELSYATQNHLPVAQMQNKAGKWVTPSAQAATAAIASFKTQLDSDLRSPIVEPPASAADAYPISGMTYLIIPKDGADRNKRAALKDFLQYVITQGQQISPNLDYSQIPQSLEQADQKILGALTASGQAL